MDFRSYLPVQIPIHNLYLSLSLSLSLSLLSFSVEEEERERGEEKGSSTTEMTKIWYRVVPYNNGTFFFY